MIQSENDADIQEAAHEASPVSVPSLKTLQYQCISAVLVCILSYFVCVYIWPWLKSVYRNYVYKKRVLKRLADNTSNTRTEHEELQAMLLQHLAVLKNVSGEPEHKSLQPDFNLSLPIVSSSSAPETNSTPAQHDTPTQRKKQPPQFKLKRKPNTTQRIPLPPPSSIQLPAPTSELLSCTAPIMRHNTSLHHQHDTALNNIYTQERELIAQQDAEFEESAAIDRLKLSPVVSPPVAPQAVFREYALKEEPEHESDTVVLSVKIPDRRVSKPKQLTIRRRFRTSDSISHVFEWIKNSVKSDNAVELVLMYPQLVLTEAMCDQCLSEVGIVENTALVYRPGDYS